MAKSLEEWLETDVAAVRDKPMRWRENGDVAPLPGKLPSTLSGTSTCKRHSELPARCSRPISG